MKLETQPHSSLNENRRRRERGKQKEGNVELTTFRSFTSVYQQLTHLIWSPTPQHAPMRFLLGLNLGISSQEAQDSSSTRGRSSLPLADVLL